MRVRFWGTRGSMPVALTAADVRDKLAQALVAAAGRRFESFGAAYDFAQRELPFALTHTYGGHSSCVELETGSNEYFVCDMGSGARPAGDGERVHVARPLGPHHGLSLLRTRLRAGDDNPHPPLPRHPGAGAPAAAGAALFPGTVRPAGREARVREARARRELRGRR